MAQQPSGNAYQDYINRDRQAYFLNLVYQQRVPAPMAMQMTIEKFGVPKSKQELAKEKAGQEQKSGIAQGVGSLAGMYGASQVSSLFGGGSAAASGAGAAGAGTAGAAGTAGTAGTAGSAGAAGAGTASAGAGAAGTSSLASAGSVALPVAAALATLSNIWETGGKDIVRGRGKSDDWANQGFNMVLGPVGPIALRMMGKRSLGRMITGGKSDAQEMRDMFRKDLRNEEIADKDWNVTLADGSKYNIGLDGKAKLQNVGENIDKKTERRVWDVDFSNPLAKKAVDLVNAKVMERYGGIKGVAPEQFTGMLVNAITSNAKNEQDLMANYNSVLGKSSYGGGQMAPQVNPQALVRPKKGEVLRVSPGLYRTDTGRLQQGSNIRQALERAYNKGK